MKASLLVLLLLPSFPSLSSPWCHHVELSEGKEGKSRRTSKEAFTITQVRTLRGQARVVAEKVVRRAWTLNMSDSGAER